MTDAGSAFRGVTTEPAWRSKDRAGGPHCLDRNGAESCRPSPTPHPCLPAPSPPASSPGEVRLTKLLAMAVLTHTEKVTGHSSAWLERTVRDREVGGSNPLAPTDANPGLASNCGLGFVVDGTAGNGPCSFSCSVSRKTPGGWPNRQALQPPGHAGRALSRQVTPCRRKRPCLVNRASTSTAAGGSPRPAAATAPPATRHRASKQVRPREQAPGGGGTPQAAGRAGREPRPAPARLADHRAELVEKFLDRVQVE